MVSAAVCIVCVGVCLLHVHVHPSIRPPHNPTYPPTFHHHQQQCNPTKHHITNRLDEALDEAAATPSTTPGPSPLLLPPDQPEALVAVAWDALLFSGAPAVRQLAARVVDTVAAARRAEAAGGGGREADEGRDAELRALLEEGLGEAMAPFEAAAARAWALLRGRLVGQCAGALEGGVKGIMAAYRMTNKRAPERACPYVARVLDPLRALEPEVKGRCVLAGVGGGCLSA